MELKDTIEMMTSADYKERFKAEYCQLAIRFKKLRNMVENWDNLKFTPTCPVCIFGEQLVYMNSYICTLIERAKLEQIELPDLESL